MLVDLLMSIIKEFNYGCDHNTQVFALNPSETSPYSVFSLSGYLCSSTEVII